MHKRWGAGCRASFWRSRTSDAAARTLKSRLRASMRVPQRVQVLHGARRRSGHDVHEHPFEASRSADTAALPVAAAADPVQTAGGRPTAARPASLGGMSIGPSGSALTSSTSTACDRSRCSPRWMSRIRSRTCACAAPASLTVRVAAATRRQGTPRAHQDRHRCRQGERCGHQHQPRQSARRFARSARWSRADTACSKPSGTSTGASDGLVHRTRHLLKAGQRRPARRARREVRCRFLGALISTVQ